MKLVKNFCLYSTSRRLQGLLGRKMKDIYHIYNFVKAFMQQKMYFSCESGSK